MIMKRLRGYAFNRTFDAARARDVAQQAVLPVLAGNGWHRWQYKGRGTPVQDRSEAWPPEWFQECVASLYEAPVFPAEGEIHGVPDWRDDDLQSLRPRRC